MSGGNGGQNSSEDRLAVRLKEHERETHNYTEQGMMGKQSPALGGGLMKGGSAMAALDALIVEAERKDKANDEYVKLLHMLQARLAWLDAEIDRLEGEIGELDQQIDALEGMIDALEKGESIYDEHGRIKPEFTEAEAAIKAYEKLHGPIDRSDPAQVQKALEYAKAERDKKDKELNGHKDEADKLEKQVGEIEKVGPAAIQDAALSKLIADFGMPAEGDEPAFAEAAAPKADPLLETSIKAESPRLAFQEAASGEVRTVTDAPAFTDDGPRFEV